jgi:hypothetical protein
MSFGESVLNLLFSLVLLQFIGIKGVAIGTFLASFLTIVLPGVIFIRREFHGKVDVKLGPLIVMSLPTVCVLLYLSQYIGELALLGKVIVFMTYFLITVTISLKLNRKLKEVIMSFLLRK